MRSSPRFRSLFVALLLCSPSAWSKVETGQGIFFPRALGDKIEAYASFPLTWWNFLVFELRDESELAYVSHTCTRLGESARSSIAALGCGESLGAFHGVLKAWARDFPLRQDKPSDAELGAKLRATLAKASLPLPRELLAILRFDPLESYRALQERLRERSPFHLPRREGVFYDEKAKRALVPIKLAFGPTDVDGTEAVLATLARECGAKEACDRWELLGPHAATRENQQRIRRDLSSASLAGATILALGLLALALLGRARLLLLAPLVAFAVGAGTLATWLAFGSVHGLTLSFGSALVGLALDYGLHQALNPQRYVARSNLFGLLTTLAALAVVMASQVPLLRQLMLFSIAGLATAFLLVRLFGPSSVPPTSFTPRPGRGKLLVTLLMALGGLWGAFRIHPSLDLARFNFQSERTREGMSWLVKVTALVPPLFSVDNQGDTASRLERGAAALAEAKARKLRVESIASYLPPVSAQRVHRATWCTASDSFEKKASAEERAFFAPFFRELDCKTLAVRDKEPLPSYVADFTSPRGWLTLYFPTTKAQELEVRTGHLEVTSLRALVAIFPETLAAELRWMAPLTLAILFGLLLLHYGRPSLALLPLVPFFTGVGLVAWSIAVLHLEASFVTLVGLVMLCGLSVDYGIFAADAVRLSAPEQARCAWSAILFAGAATLCGFVPLLFCRHAVLAQLGQVLVIGTLGTLWGAVWGIPSIAAWREARPA